MPAPTRSFWSGRRVLVTGNTGFKGSWLCALLLRLGARVTGAALEPEGETNLWTLAGLAADVDARTLDVRDAAAMRELVRARRPATILHLAAQPLVRRGYREPAETYATNVMGTVHVLDAARLAGDVGEIVVVTSDKVYRDAPLAGGYDETARLGGADPYSGSKACAELVVETYRDAYFSGSRGPALASARAGNVIGGGDYSADRLIPDFVRAIESHAPLVLRNPHAVRPWQHVLDPLTGYLLAAEALARDPAAAAAWNFGPAEPGIAVRAVVDAFARAWGDPSFAEVRVDPSPEHETARLEIDASRARAQFGWAPRWTTAEAVARTAVWYRERAAGAPARALIERDLEAHAAA